MRRTYEVEAEFETSLVLPTGAEEELRVDLMNEELLPQLHALYDSVGYVAGATDPASPYFQDGHVQPGYQGYKYVDKTVAKN